MKRLLLIHTTLNDAFTAITNDEQIVRVAENSIQKDHGSFLHESIKILFDEEKLVPGDIDAVAVTSGPGSYTGIRVGLSAAKGIGYALEKPIIVCSTLEALAATAYDEIRKAGTYIPLIHARMQEFYAGFYNEKMEKIRPEGWFDLKNGIDLQNGDRYFFGPGINPEILTEPDYQWLDIQKVNVQSFGISAFRKFCLGELTEAGLVAPNYLKEAYTTAPKK